MAPTFKLMGGLGNQLFVYAAALFHAIEFGRKVSLDPQFAAGSKRGHTHHLFSTSLERLHLDPRVVLAPNRHNLKNAVLNFLSDGQLKLARKETGLLKTHEDSGGHGHHVGERALYVRGFFQNYKYLHSLKQRKEWVIPQPIVVSPEAQDLAKRISAEKSVVIHLRRGDYKNLGSSFGMLGLGYYLNALEHLERERGSLGKVFVFSDDVELVHRDLLPNLVKLYDIEPVKPLSSPEQDLFAMSHASNFVLANSSFSWWAANLGSNEEHPKVAYPQPWFRKSSFSNDLFPGHWMPIHATWESDE